jgi:hypothetical protein
LPRRPSRSPLASCDLMEQLPKREKSHELCPRLTTMEPLTSPPVYTFFRFLFAGAAGSVSSTPATAYAACCCSARDSSSYPRGQMVALPIRGKTSKAIPQEPISSAPRRIRIPSRHRPRESTCPTALTTTLSDQNQTLRASSGSWRPGLSPADCHLNLPWCLFIYRR